MSVTRFFPWPPIGAWLEARPLARYDFAGLDQGTWTAQQQLTLELALNGYAILDRRHRHRPHRPEPAPTSLGRRAMTPLPNRRPSKPHAKR